MKVQQKKDLTFLALNERFKPYGFILLPLGFTFAVYASVLNFGFVWDDTIYLQNQLPAFQTVGDAFFPQEKIAQFYDRYYRPLIYVSYLFDRSLWGFNPYGYHLTGLLFHLGCTVLVFILTSKLLRERQGIPWGALIASLSFGVHPVHTESVAWMSGRSDVIACFFMLAAVLCVIGDKKGGRVWAFYFLSSVFFFFALLGKEASISLMLLYPLIPFLFRKQIKTFPWGEMIQVSIFPMMAVGVYFILRVAAMESMIGAHDWSALPIFEAGSRMVLAYGFYLWKLLWPFNLNAFIGSVPHTAGFFLFSFLLVGVWVGISCFGFLKKKGFVFFSGAWVLATLSPSVLISLTGVPTPLAERYLYIPSLGFSLLLGGLVFLKSKLLLEKGWEKSRGIHFFLMSGVIDLLFFGYTFLTVQRLPVWKNNQTFWMDTARSNPKAWLPHQNLGLVFHELGQYDQAEGEFQRALDLAEKPEEVSSTLTSVGITLMRQGKSQAAEGAFLRSLETGVVSPYVYYALGFLYNHQWSSGEGSFQSERERLDRARFYFQKATELNPYYTQAFFELGELDFKRGDFKEALVSYERVLSLAVGAFLPLQQKARFQLSRVHLRRGDQFFLSHEYGKALKAYEIALQHQAHDEEGRFKLGLTLAHLGRIEESMQAYRLVLQNNPGHAEARFNLGLLLEKTGDSDQAIREYRSILNSGIENEILLRAVKKRLGHISQ